MGKMCAAAAGGSWLVTGFAKTLAEARRKKKTTLGAGKTSLPPQLPRREFVVRQFPCRDGFFSKLRESQRHSTPDPPPNSQQQQLCLATTTIVSVSIGSQLPDHRSRSKNAVSLALSEANLYKLVYSAEQLR